MPKRVAILQSSYIPWKGYFDIIHDVDEFIFLDDVHYTSRDWRSRNIIKTPQGPQWLTIPIGHVPRGRLISDVDLPSGWADSHWRRLESCYAKAPYYPTYGPIVRKMYLAKRWQSLSELNQSFIRTIANDFLGVQTSFRDSREFAARNAKQEGLLDLIRAADAQIYVSGPAAKAYIDPDSFGSEGVKLVWKSYDGYPEYPQFHPPFTHHVTVLDLLFHVGANAKWFIWGWRRDRNGVP